MPRPDFLQQPLPIATRTSPLALAQANDFQRRLSDAWEVPETQFPLLGMTTTGDRITDRALLAAGGKGLFTKELERALLDDAAAFAVHSTKDLPTKLPGGLMLGAFLRREDPRDVLLTREGSSRIQDLPAGAVLGTASIRRQAQALALRPDLKVVLLRGNVDTRLKKLREGEVDATFLARAGLRRLGRAEAGLEPLEIEEMLPAPGQGAVSIEICAHSTAAARALEPLQDLDTACAVIAERAFLEALDGSCRTPIAAHARINGNALELFGEALTPDGKHRWRAQGACEAGDMSIARAHGFKLGVEVALQGGDTLRAAIAETDRPA